MKLKLIAAAALAVAAVGVHAASAEVSINGGAFASVSETGTAANPYLLGSISSIGSALLKITGAVGSFTDYATFSLSSPYTGVDSSGGYFKITGFTTSIFSGTPTGTQSLLGSALGGDPMSLTGLTPGSYFLKMEGVATNASATYLAGVAATPVPEPETYALMAAGLAVIGFVAKRRKSV
jgi:hypothetical protein